MAYSEDKIRLTVAADEDHNEKLEVFPEAMCRNNEESARNRTSNG